MFNIVDTHCHLDLIEKKGQEIEITLQKAKKSNVKKILQIATDLESSKKAKEISDIYSSSELEIFYTIGCHPTEVFSSVNLDDFFELLKLNLNDKKLTGIGEVGLDLYHSKKTQKEQEMIFHKFIQASIESKLPLSIHSRNCYIETKNILKEYKGKIFGVMHCFSYDYKAAKELIDCGFYVSLSGILTFKNAREIQETASKLPLETILLETDAPFLAPTPYRSKMNEPYYLPQILEYFLQLRIEKNEKIEETLFQNSLDFLNRKSLF